MRGLAACLATLALGCESVNVGTALPVPGPVKPSVGVSVGKSGVKGHAGASAKIGKVPVGVSGTSKPLSLTGDSGTTAAKKTEKKKSAKK